MKNLIQKPKTKENLIDASFHLVLLFKSLGAVGEALGGLALLLIPLSLVKSVVFQSVQILPLESLQDFAQQLNSSMVGFAAIYLLSHGLVKCLSLGLLWKKILWAYPLSVLLFSGFIGYQLSEFAKHGSMSMIVLTVIDLLMIVLTLLEYRNIKGQWSSVRADRNWKTQLMNKFAWLKKFSRKCQRHSSMLMIFANLSALISVFVSAQYLF